jgi:hypothetical protein
LLIAFVAFLFGKFGAFGGVFVLNFVDVYRELLSGKDA